MKNRIWVGVLSLLVLASCQSSRFMQDDMYFSEFDAKREIREYELNKKANLPVEDAKADVSAMNADKDFNSDNYYDYSYSSRLKRFNTPNNTWSYYDPYYTNYYWYNTSNTKYFGNSVYSTYSWWGPNFGINYDANYWGSNEYGMNAPRKGWNNPFKNNPSSDTWWNPYSPFVYNGWNNTVNNSASMSNGKSYNNMYYNSLDNNCYVGDWNKKSNLNRKDQLNFVELMQQNGMAKDVTLRSDINYTALRERNNLQEDKISTSNLVDSNIAIVASKSNVVNTSLVDKSTINTGSTNNHSADNVNVKNVNTNTAKRWDNYNADLNISPNNSNTNNNWSKSGVFSEGSRNNNYEYKGSTMPKNKTTNTNIKKTGTHQDGTPK